jgi:hypothetical protein
MLLDAAAAALGSENMIAKDHQSLLRIRNANASLIFAVHVLCMY